MVQWMNERASMFRYTYVDPIVFSSPQSCERVGRASRTVGSNHDAFSVTSANL